MVRCLGSACALRSCVSCVWLSRKVHLLQLDPNKFLIPFFVAACIIAHGLVIARRHLLATDQEPPRRTLTGSLTLVCTVDGEPQAHRRSRRQEKFQSDHAELLTSRQTRTWLMTHWCTSLLRDTCQHSIAGKAPDWPHRRVDRKEDEVPMVQVKAASVNIMTRKRRVKQKDDGWTVHRNQQRGSEHVSQGILLTCTPSFPHALSCWSLLESFGQCVRPSVKDKSICLRHSFGWCGNYGRRCGGHKDGGLLCATAPPHSQTPLL